ncbi:hypothetical protein LguiA_033705 [Lonicera macranthoides]
MLRFVKNSRRIKVYVEHHTVEFEIKVDNISDLTANDNVCTGTNEGNGGLGTNNVALSTEEGDGVIGNEEKSDINSLDYVSGDEELIAIMKKKLQRNGKFIPDELANGMGCPNVNVTALPPVGLDHNPILIDPLLNVVRRRKSFRLNSTEPKQVVSRIPGSFGCSDLADKEVDTFDVVVCGGTLGIFIAIAWSNRGLQFSVVERNLCRKREQELNISWKELMEPVEVGISAGGDIDEATAVMFRTNKCGLGRVFDVPLLPGAVCDERSSLTPEIQLSLCVKVPGTKSVFVKKWENFSEVIGTFTPATLSSKVGVLASSWLLLSGSDESASLGPFREGLDTSLLRLKLPCLSNGLGKPMSSSLELEHAKELNSFGFDVLLLTGGHLPGRQVPNNLTKEENAMLRFQSWHLCATAGNMIYSLLWHYNYDGRFSVKSGYHVEYAPADLFIDQSAESSQVALGVRWCKPSAPWIHVNIDSAVLCNDNIRESVLVGRNRDGALIFAVVKCLIDHFAAELTEAYAIPCCREGGDFSRFSYG